ncbi:BMP family lipoprotein [Nocardioides bruguierae]|uniref:BMP family ABC transporter substrate-binding protein n=1 Tax=Nocardioides bruguierae TaxID=2945102 RepID=A0A9X2D8F6_9ACTN|nr:BMP family ABC transporter substrate-binding protein [Nocardioides bruguierae]MCL8025212.1 BMP family ABC transporter substrate-binding protein [Nocardioides bruguierae]MCM0621283.1 BMP family ABC transporter substrate-binding protein [Nocardioides bruguierae]
MRKAGLGLSLAVAASLALTSCGEAPDETTSSDSGETTSDFLPCIVSDAGGFDDKSFNQLSYEGVQQAADELGADFKAVESNSESDYAPNMESLVAEGCDVIVSVGFALSAATVESATANPDLPYVLIDDQADNDFDGTKDADNIKPLLYDTAQAAFLAGYAAADFSKTGTVGTYGGAEYPTVTIFMDGYYQGVQYYNEQKGADVQVVGWDGSTGSFTGGFSANQKATNTAQQILDQGADVILPVGGPIYQGALTAIADSGSDAVMIGTDADLYESDPNSQDVVFTSILKNMKLSTYEAVMSVADEDFDAEAYVGTLDNDGVGIASFHDYEGEVSDSLQGELDDITAGIIDGSIPVTSYLN